MSATTSGPRRSLFKVTRRDSRSIVTRTIIASVVLAALVAASFVVLLVAVSTLRDTNEQESRSKDVTASTLRLEKLVLDLDTGLNGFVITGNPKVLDTWRSALREIPGETRTLQRLSADDPTLNRQAHRLTTAVQQYVEDYSVPVARIAQINPAAAKAPVATSEGRRRITDIRDQFQRFKQIDTALAAAREDRTQTQANRAVQVGIIALLVSAILALLFGAHIARAIARPVREAAIGATHIAGGDLSTRLPEHGPGEVGELTRAFNSMAGSLQRSRQELVAQNEALRESERMKSELISVVSHELRTPLASVVGYARLLVQRTFDESARRRYLEILDREAQRLAQLVDDFLDAERLEHGRLELQQEPVDVGALLREQAWVFAGQSEIHTIDVQVPDEPLPVRGDPGRLTQVVGNLLSNAIKYSPEGGTVTVAARQNGVAVRMLVTDDGVGIAEEHRHGMFTKFFRGGATASGIPGTGLGLAITREIVEAHGGRIDFTSVEAKGSTFWVDLPAVTADQAPARGEVAASVEADA
jgi:signal transduction histidine kinase